LYRFNFILHQPHSIQYIIVLTEHQSKSTQKAVPKTLYGLKDNLTLVNKTLQTVRQPVSKPLNLLPIQYMKWRFKLLNKFKVIWKLKQDEANKRKTKKIPLTQADIVLALLCTSKQKFVCSQLPFGLDSLRLSNLSG
jgi:hypothetical protein